MAKRLQQIAGDAHASHRKQLQGLAMLNPVGFADILNIEQGTAY
jgi:hypothetical protein